MCGRDDSTWLDSFYPPPTFRGVRERGTKPRVELEPPTFHG